MARTTGWLRSWRGACVGAGLCVALAALAGSCLVTDHPEYGEPVIPSTLVRVTPEGFARVPADPDEQCASGTPIDERTRDTIDWMAFVVDVSDVNIEDELELRLVINGEHRTAHDVPRTGGAERGRFVLCAKLQQLSAVGCNRVEILASSDFSADGFPYGTRYGNDLASWEWWVLGPAREFPEVYASDCTMRFPDAGVLP